MQVVLTITADPQTRTLNVTGPVDDPLLYGWILNEARRICKRRASERDDKASNGGNPQIVVARDIPR